jgi:hypothetical protein
MTNTIELEVAIVRSGVTKEAIAKALKLSNAGLYNKLKGLTEFKASEISTLQQLLNLTDMQRDLIFFSNFVD